VLFERSVVKLPYGKLPLKFKPTVPTPITPVVGSVVGKYAVQLGQLTPSNVTAHGPTKPAIPDTPVVSGVENRISAFDPEFTWFHVPGIPAFPPPGITVPPYTKVL
jgi:hypothetical protein